MPARKIGNLLAQSGQLRALSRQAQRLAELQQVLFEAVPPLLTSATRVKNYRAGTLFLLADNAAVAAKLRQLAPRLLVHVRKRETQVTGIQVEVQVAAHQTGLPKRSRKRELNVAAIDDFQALADVLHDAPLKRAVTRLVQRRKGKRDIGPD
ncbi:MAG: DUF721 domain-containing protein [Betaproteobacteria bacterium]|nr:DUF721 domain-containing protein [Betaproteobacteria bacterium]